MKVLVTGGAGYIGSTICSALLDAGHTPIILDSLIVGKEEFTRGRIFYKGDIADEALLERIFHDHPEIYATIHCAALIIVPESVARPYDYYHENVAKSLELFRVLNKLGCGRVVFSSSASLYDTVPGFMVTEDAPLKPSSPYARTKFMMEMILQDFSRTYDFRAIALRYFNPIGSDPQMRSGLHIKTPSLVLGQMVMAARGEKEAFELTGTDWTTRDGSGIRDYVHVWDLAQAHIKAVEHFDQVFERLGTGEKYTVINLGTGKGVTTKELVAAFERVYGKEINKKICPPRPGDVAGAYANGDKARRLLDWEPKLSIDQGIADALKWAELRTKILKFD